MFERACLAALFALAGLAACRSSEVDPREDQEAARTLIRDSTGESAVYDPLAAPLAAGEIEAILEGGLGLDESLRLALLNNRRLQADFANLGVARADFVQAGLLRNPSLGLGFLLPSGGGRPKLTAELAQSLVDLWELPTRQDLARDELQGRILELSRRAGELLFDVKLAYFESVAARDRLELLREGAELARAMVEGVEGRVGGGVATGAELALARSQALGEELALRSAERVSTSALRRLAALLSLEGDILGCELLDGLGGFQAREWDREALVARSHASRLDLRAAEAAVRSADARVALERGRARPGLELSLAAERPETGSSVDLLWGPGATVELPLFDRNVVQWRRAQFQREELAKQAEALRAEIAQQTRAAVDRALAAQRVSHLVVEELLPQAQLAAELARKAYELGDTTALALLASRRAELQARSSLLDALLELASAQVEVERAVGAPLDGRAGGSAKPR